MSDSNSHELEIARMAGILPEEYNATKLKEAKETAINSMMTPDELKICMMTGADPIDYLKIAGRLDLNTMLNRDEIDACTLLNVDPFDFYVAKKFKC